VGRSLLIRDRESALWIKFGFGIFMVSFGGSEVERWWKLNDLSDKSISMWLSFGCWKWLLKIITVCINHKIVTLITIEKLEITSTTISLYVWKIKEASTFMYLSEDKKHLCVFIFYSNYCIVFIFHTIKNIYLFM